MEISLDTGSWWDETPARVLDRLRRDAITRARRTMELAGRVDALEAENNELRFVINLLMQTLRSRGILHDEDLRNISNALADLQSIPSSEFVVDDSDPPVSPVEVATEDLAALAAASERAAAEQEFHAKLLAKPSRPERE